MKHWLPFVFLLITSAAGLAQPAITSFAPASAAVGAAVTITGSGFNTTAASNIVFFGATKGIVNTATATQLTVIVPAGATYAPITVLNNATGLQAYSSKQFLSTFTGGGIGFTDNSFTGKVDFSTGANPSGLCISDIDGDGKPDVLTANRDANTVSVLKNQSTNGTVSFDSKVDFATGINPLAIAAGDLNGDGKPDIVITNNTSNTISVLLNNSTIGVISFASPVTYSVGTFPSCVAIKDIDEDGKADIILLNGSYVSIFRNTSSVGAISFASKVDLATDPYPNTLYIGDADGDNHPDIIVGTEYFSKVLIFRNTSSTGAISFATRVDVDIDFNPSDIFMNDINGDGKEDLVIAYRTSGIGLLKNNSIPGSVSFSANTTIKHFFTDFSNLLIDYLNKLTINDFDGDSIPDIGVSNTSVNTLSLFKNNNIDYSTLTLSKKNDFLTGTIPSAISSCDIDGDGKPDLVVTNAGLNTVSVLRNIHIPFVKNVSIHSDNARTNKAKAGDNIILSFTASESILTPVINIAAHSISATNTLANDWTANYQMQADDTEGTIKFTLAFSNLSGVPGITDTTTTNGSLVRFDKTRPVVSAISRLSPIDSLTHNTSLIYRVIFSETVFGVTSSAFQLLPTGTVTASVASVSTSHGSTIDVMVNSVSGDGDLYLQANGSGIIDSSGNALAVTAPSINQFYTVDQSLVAPTILSFSPTAALMGANITITGTDFRAITSVTFGGTSVASFTVLSSTTIVAVTGGGATGSLSVTGAGGTGALTGFTYLVLPTITSFTPMAAAMGGTLTITGTNLTNITSLTLGGTNAASFNVLSSTTATAVVGSGSSGSISITTVGGTAALTGFVYLPPSTTISSIAPESGLVGSVVTITGSNFSATPSSNIVYFGTVKAAVISASASQLTVFVPASANYDLVTVLNMDNGLMAYSPKPFLPTTLSGNGTSFKFSKRDFGTGTTPLKVCLSDFDNDGKPDMVVINQSANTVSVYKNTSLPKNISFAAKADFATGILPSGMAIADIDGDGKPDIITSNYNANTVSVLLNTSSGGSISFAAKVDFVTANSPYGIAVNDIDGDGRSDIVVANSNANTISVLRNISSTGMVSFADKADFVAGSYPISVCIRDFDGDSHADIAVANQLSANVSLFRNTSIPGTISFVRTNVNVISNPISIAAEDLDGNGKPDLIVGMLSATDFVVLSNGSSVGTIFFGFPSGYVISSGNSNVASITLNDFDEDGRADLAFGNITSNSVSTIKSYVGAFAFHSPVNFAVGQAPRGITSGDIDGDGTPDIAIANPQANTVSVLRNRQLEAAPSITSFAPVSAATGATITVTGSDFIDITGITLGGTAVASFQVLSSTVLTVTVGAGSSGILSVTGTAGSGGISGFIYLPPPIISSFTPTMALSGAVITITGLNFTGITSVKIGTTDVSSFTVLSSTTIRAIVDTGSSGSVTVNNPVGTGSLIGFTFLPPVPTITSFTPTSAALGATITITGTSFIGVTAVKLGTTSLNEMQVASPTTIVGKIGSGSSGDVSVTTPSGTARLEGFTFLAAPTITSFVPAFATSTTTITITGTNLGSVTSVKLGGTSVASFTILSSTALTAVVGPGTSGSVTVSNGETTGSLAGFTFMSSAAPPTITAFTPTSARIGAVITITGTNFIAGTTVKLGPASLGDIHIVSSTTVTGIVGAESTSGNVTVTTFNGTATLAGFDFQSGSTPIISSFTPRSAAPGNTITITGTALNSVNSVKLGGTPAASFTILSGNTLLAVVGSGSSGEVFVGIDQSGTALGGFIFLPSPNAPTISSFTPTSAGSGATITITGTNLTGATSVKVGATALDAIQIASPTTITGIVGTGSSGAITVTTPNGTAALAGFTFLPANTGTPTITSFTPTSATTGAIITITGTNLTSPTSVKLGTSSLDAILIASPTTIVGKVGAGSTGDVSVTTPNGTAALAGFTFLPANTGAPTITSFAPTSAGMGSVITITGTNFTGATSVTLGTTSLDAIQIASPTTITGIVGSGSSGAITITTPNGTAALAGFTFLPANTGAPTITSFTPTSAAAGAIITITGTNLTGPTSVKLGTSSLDAILIASPTTIVGKVGAGSTGDVSVTTPNGTATLGRFTFLPANTGAPTITSFTPTSAAAGAIITITGTNFTGATSVKLGTTSLDAIQIASPTTITGKVGTGSSGAVTVTTPNGTATLAGFTFITSVPTIKTNGATIFCQGQSVVLTTSDTTNTTQWFKDGAMITGAQSRNYTAVQSGSYTVKAGSNGFFSEASQPVVITVNPVSVTAKPQLAGYESDTLTCFATSLTIASKNVYDKYLWSTGEISSSITVNSNVDVSLKVANNQFSITCYSEPSVVITARKNITPLPIISRKTTDSLASSNSLAYRWLFNNKLTGDTLNQLLISGRGIYNVSTSIDKYCWNTSPDYIVLLDPVTVKKAFDLTLYPNPTNGIFSILVKFEKNTSAVIKITITDATGIVKWNVKKLLFSDKSIKIPVSLTLAKGIYSIKVDVNGEVNTQQLVVM